MIGYRPSPNDIQVVNIGSSHLTFVFISIVRVN